MLEHVHHTTPSEWDHLQAERESIMLDSGIAAPVARAKALLDTIANHGHRPQVNP